MAGTVSEPEIPPPLASSFGAYLPVVKRSGMAYFCLVKNLPKPPPVLI